MLARGDDPPEPPGFPGTSTRQNATGRLDVFVSNAGIGSATARAELWRRSLELTGHPDIG